MSRNELLDALLALPIGERLVVVREVMKSLDDEQLSPDDWRSAWGSELNHRIQRMQAGEQGVSMDALLAELESEGDRQAS